MKKIKLPKPKARSGAKVAKAPKNILGKPATKAKFSAPRATSSRRKREMF